MPKPLALGLAVSTGGLVLSPTAAANFIIEDFDNFTPFAPTNYFAGWNPTVATSGATGFTIDATGFGGFFEAVQGPPPVPPVVDTLQLDVTVNTGPVNLIVVTDDGLGGQSRYFFGAVPAGNSVLTADLVADNTLATSALTELISFYQVQGEFGTPYNVTFNDLRLVQIPEPASAGLLGLGGILAARRRR
ncbi:MAG: PEP-CTERM sorting domain-containing protein [Planctomycetota bacterium]